MSDTDEFPRLADITYVGRRLAALVVDELGRRLVQPAECATAVPAPHADTVIDQDSGLIPREQYLRMARRGDFPSVKEGRRVYAFWGEVRDALAARMKRRGGEGNEPANHAGPPLPSTGGANDNQTDELAEHRKALGLVGNE